MKCLFIDTSSSYMTVAITTESEVRYSYQNKILSDMASKIMPIIANCLDNCKLSINDIDKIFIVNGPGSFTGIRVGVTVAKTIAWALKKQIVPISSLEFLATTPTSKKYVVPMIDARRNNVYTGIYDNSLNCILKDRLINITELLKNINDDCDCISYDEINIRNINKPNPDILKIIKKHINDRSINSHNLNPNYLKLTEAEENRKNND